MSEDTLTITDNRTGKQYQLPIEDGTIKAMDLRQIKVSDDDFGLMTYDPAFMNTASCKSRITFIDGDKGILEYRGYPIDQLAEKSSYLEVAYLLLYGELPNDSQLKEWTRNITYHTFINENIKKVIDGFHYNAHPMGMFEATLGALSTFYPGRKRHLQRRVSLETDLPVDRQGSDDCGVCFRHRIGMQYSYPDNDLSYEGNFLNMMFKTTELKYKPNPVLERALDGALHTSRRSRTELQHQRDAQYRQRAHRSVFVAGGRGRGALWSIARRRERDGACGC